MQPIPGGIESLVHSLIFGQGGGGGPWFGDFAAYQTVYDWSGTTKSIPAQSWGTFVNVVGEGWLVFVQADATDSNSPASQPDIRVTVDGAQYLFEGFPNINPLHGHRLVWPIHFRSGLKVEVYNRHTSLQNFICDYTYLLKQGAPRPFVQTVLSSTARRLFRGTTGGTSMVDVANITGSGYLLAVQNAVNQIDLADMSHVTIIVDGVTKMSDRRLWRTNTDPKLSPFLGPIRFNSNLRVQHRTWGGDGISITWVHVLLD